MRHNLTLFLAQPHNAVDDSSFFKHIDVEQEEIDRVRQLLIWCASRASSATTSSSSSSLSTAPSTSTSLPHLSSRATQLLKGPQDDVVRMLAEKEINLVSLNTSTSSGTIGKKLNDQNVSNRAWEVTYGEQIQRSVTVPSINALIN